MIMSTLKEKLVDFEKQIKETTKKEDLQILFEKLAPAFLYGGYIQVREDLKVFIKTVEFYFHSEKPDGVHDPIVYHRDGRGLDKVPYFPIMTLHSHDSGFDITFESEAKKYRASVLIRAYEVKYNEEYLEWNKKDKYISHPTYKFNTQSLYLRKLLNGFSLIKDNEIQWKDEPREQSVLPIKKKRRNVYQYDRAGNKTKCDRFWSFTRVEQV